MALIKLKDSMSTIQSKLNSSKDIQFEPGIYKITKQLIINEGTTIDLNGATLQRKASIQSIFLNRVTSSTKKYSGAGNIRIQNGTFEGMGGYSYDNLLTFFHSHDVSIINCVFKDILCHGIEFNSSEKCIVHDCKFFGYNLKNKDSAYNECIQIDHAGFSGFVLSGSSRSSACYDGTCCKNIEISNCFFSKSNYRDYPYACVGEHSQLRGNYKHKDIRILNNIFDCKLNPDLVQACVSITSMENVLVENNVFNCGRVARIYSKNKSYTLNGKDTTAKDGDGICKNVTIRNNTIAGCTSKTAFQVYNKSGNTNHTGITKKNNIFKMEVLR